MLQDEHRNKPLEIFLGTLFLAGICFVLYKSYYFSYAEYRYTVAVVTGEYHDAKTVGVKFQYTVQDKLIESNCIDNDCHGLKKGSRYIVKYFVERITWNSLLVDLEVPDQVVPPREGWKEVPKW